MCLLTSLIHTNGVATTQVARRCKRSRQLGVDPKECPYLERVEGSKDGDVHIFTVASSYIRLSSRTWSREAFCPRFRNSLDVIKWCSENDPPDRPSTMERSEIETRSLVARPSKAVDLNQSMPTRSKDRRNILPSRCQSPDGALSSSGPRDATVMRTSSELPQYGLLREPSQTLGLSDGWNPAAVGSCFLASSISNPSPEDGDPNRNGGHSLTSSRRFGFAFPQQNRSILGVECLRRRSLSWIRRIGGAQARNHIPVDIKRTGG